MHRSRQNILTDHEVGYNYRPDWPTPCLPSAPAAHRNQTKQLCFGDPFLALHVEKTAPPLLTSKASEYKHRPNFELSLKQIEQQIIRAILPAPGSALSLSRPGHVSQLSLQKPQGCAHQSCHLPCCGKAPTAPMWPQHASWRQPAVTSTQGRPSQAAGSLYNKENHSRKQMHSGKTVTNEALIGDLASELPQRASAPSHRLHLNCWEAAAVRLPTEICHPSS